MKHADKSAFAALVKDTMAFYGRDVSTFALSVWWQACERFEYEQVVSAMTAHAMDPENGQFPPKPADIVRKLHGTHTDRSLVAWGKVLDAIHRVGAYQSVVFDDGAIHAAIEDLGGWPNVCRSNVDEMPFLQRRFCDAHKAYSLRPDHPYPTRLIGESESVNAVGGRASQAPMLVGDPARAQMVQQQGCEGSKTQITSAADVIRLPGLSRDQGKAA